MTNINNAHRDESDVEPKASVVVNLAETFDQQHQFGLVQDDDFLFAGNLDSDLDVKPQRKNTGSSETTSSMSLSGRDHFFTFDCESPHVKKADPGVSEESEAESIQNIRQSPCKRRLKRLFGFILFFALFWFTVIMIGAEMEKRRFSKMAGTTELYSVDDVCTVDESNPDAVPISYSSVELAHEDQAEVAHCGECGECSNLHDLSLYVKSRDYLTDVSTRCAFNIFIGMNSVRECMEEGIGFTTPCNECWLDNIKCSFHECKFSCIKYKLFNYDTNGDDGQLSDCLRCDEKMCGPQFISCSGSNRRRMGVVSDIGRDENSEQCDHTDINWLESYI